MIISHGGLDGNRCGIDIPCHTVWHTLTKRAKNGDTVVIDAGNTSKPFTVEKSCQLLQNITVTGINGRPVIKGNESVLSPFLFDDKIKELNTTLQNIKIHVANVWFQRIGIVRIRNSSTILVVQMSNCTVSESIYHHTSSVIESSSTTTLVLIQNCFIYNAAHVMTLNSPDVTIQVKNSTIRYTGGGNLDKRCPQLIHVGQYVFLSVAISSSFFTRIFVIDAKSTNQRRSKVDIIGCTFDDEGTNMSDYKCHSGMKLQNTATLIENTNFIGIYSGTGIIHITSCVVKIQNCLFSKMRSYMSPLALYLNTNASFFNCHFDKNVMLGRSGVVLLSESQGFFQNSNFQNNNLIGEAGYGGAICAVSGSGLTVQQSIFKWNKSTYIGGSVFLSGSQGLFQNSTFQANKVGGILTYGGAIGLSSMESDSVFVLQNCVFQWNNSTYTGGAIYYQILTSALESNKLTNSKNYSDFGNSVPKEQSNVIISKCWFEGNYATVVGGAIYQFGNELYIDASTFVRNRAKNGGAIRTETQSSFTIVRCVFLKNKAEFHDKVIVKWEDSFGGAIFHTGMKFSIASTEFEGNTALTPRSGFGGAIVVDTHSNMNLTMCYFQGNSAKRGGGAVDFAGQKLFIINSKFENNTANLSKAGRGGALATKNVSSVEIVNCSFNGNNAKWTGGAVYHQGTQLTIKDTLFQTLSYCYHEHYFGGEIIFSSGKIALENISMHDMDNFNAHTQLIMHISRFKDINITNINVMCYRGKNILVSLPENVYLRKTDLPGSNAFVSLAVSCSSCSQNTYSLSSGELGPDIANQKHIDCYTCPFGGNCTIGQIRAANNFWGYQLKENSKQIGFARCPSGYCCVGDQCKNYNSCANGRKGTLCGLCLQDLTEDLLTPACLKPEQCHHPWFSALVLIAGITYIAFFMYLKETAKFVSALLIPKQTFEYLRTIPRKIKNHCNKLKNKEFHATLVTNDTCCQSVQCPDVRLEHVDTMERIEPNIDDKLCETFFPGILKIIIFFYQTVVLFKIYSVPKPRGFISLIQEIIATLFNLRTDGLFYQDISWCPVNNLRSVPKLLLKASFSFYLFTVVFFILLTTKIIEILFKKDNLQDLHSRLRCCALRILLISYATVTVSCFTLLSCVQLGSVGEVLYIDGSIRCYQWWQFLTIATVCLWIGSYPVGIYTASWLLHTNKLATGRFLMSLLMPLPVIFYWIYIRISYHKDHTSRLDPNEQSDNGMDILDVLEGPFRKQIGNKNISKNYRIPWESALIGRRFVLILIKTFVIDAIVRLYLMAFFTVVFLLHHIYVRPFSSNHLNTIETISLIVLVIICGLNIAPAYVYMNPTCVSSYIQGLLTMFQHIETILMLIFPVIIVCIGSILLGLRILQCVCWLVTSCMKLTRLCCKRKVV